MATQEKLVKSLDALKSLIASNLTSDVSTRKKDKIMHCNVISEAMCNSSVRVASNFQNLLCFSIEVLLQLCDDPESDVRMVADESLNRIIRAMMNSNIIKVQLELHKEIKKNGSVRTLRAALWRFAQLCHMIRPHKGKAYVNNLIPYIVKISERTEESLLETLANSLPKIMESLGSFTSDNEIKILLKAFLQNISNTSPVIRRTASVCIVTVCINSRKPYIFITYILNTILDLIVPVTSEHSSALILGVLGCLRSIIPYLENTSNDQELKGSFGVKRSLNETPIPSSKLIQVYELCLYYISHSDHNIINAALETLNSLLQTAPVEFISLLLSPEGITKSSIMNYDCTTMLKHRSLSQISITTTRTADESALADSEVAEITTDIGKWIDESNTIDDNLSVKSLSALSIQTDDTKTDTVDHSFNICFTGMEQDIDNESGINKIEDMDITPDVLSNRSSPKLDTEAYAEIDAGSFTDRNVSFDYCCRIIAKSFLLTGYPTGLIPDKQVRISVKSLALTCLSSVIWYYPKCLLLYLDKSAKVDLDCKQRLYDILLFINHSDPQLRGSVVSLIGNFIKAVLLNAQNDYDRWFKDEIFNSLQIETLMNLIIKGLQDESSTCSRLSLIGLSNCLTNVIESLNSLSILTVLNVLPSIVSNPYWLVKVKLVETVCEIPFLNINYLTGNSDYQQKILYDVLFTLLKDEDQRVRHATALAIVKIIPKLYYLNDQPSRCEAISKAIKHKEKFLTNMFNISLDVNINEKNFINSLCTPYNHIGNKTNVETEKCLSRIVNYLSQSLLVSTSKYFTYGCCETLCLLANEYPTTIYYHGWNLGQYTKKISTVSSEVFQRSLSQPFENKIETFSSSNSGLLNVCVLLLTNTVYSHEISCHKWLLDLSGNIFAGVSMNCMKNYDEINFNVSGKPLWEMYSDGALAETTEMFLHHLIRLLNIFCHIIDETVPVLPPNKPVLPNLPPASALSPIKRRSKSDASDLKMKTVPMVKHTPEKDDKEKKVDSSKFNAMGYFANLPHYMKLYEILKMAYSNYKTTLDTSASEKFLHLLKVTLQSTSQVLEMATVNEAGRLAEELLSYLRSIVNLEPTDTVQCVLQLLKCLFGTNLCSHMDEIKPIQKQEPSHSGFYFNIFQHMYETISKNIDAMRNANKSGKDSDYVVMGYIHRKDIKQTAGFKSLSRSADKTVLASYIRLFEPMVIKALKQYTITSDVILQCKVLQLLSNLVQLRVNYCLLDSDQIFIDHVLKQFEFIEEGQIPLAQVLIPKIFQFLVHLSYEKQHSKSIINVPKIIQLCDGLMASGRSPITHFIPAIIPIIEDIFIFRNQNNTVTDVKELETTREVLFSMLLRLVEYHEVIKLLVLVVNESKYGNDNGERWIRWSGQIANIILPMMKQSRMRLECHESQIAIQSLFYVLNPTVFKSINQVLITLFSDPPHDEATIKHVSRWLGMVVSLMLLVSQVKEEVLLARINEVKSEFSTRSVFKLDVNEVPDPLNVSKVTHYLEDVPSDEIFARFIFETLKLTLKGCMNIFIKDGNCNNYIFQQFSTFMMYCIHMCHSGSHCKVANAAIQLIYHDETILIDEMNDTFLRFAPFCPLLTLKWCYLLTLLNYNDEKFWSVVLQTPKCDGIVHCRPDSVKIGVKSNSINVEIVKLGGAILYCDYMCENISDAEQLTWLLVNHIEYVIRLSDEAPVSELISAVHRNPAASGLFIQAIGSRCRDIQEPCFINKLLKCVENCHPTQSGALLLLLIPQFLTCRQLALSRYASTLASRATELLLTMPPEEINEHLAKDDFLLVINKLIDSKLVKKHESLVGLLNRLGSKCYDLSPIEFDQRRNLNPENIKNININKSWFISQVKSHCNQTKYSDKESAELINKLEYDDILLIMSNMDFNCSVLKDCLSLVQTIAQENNQKDIPLFRATVATLMNNISSIKALIPKPHQVFKPNGRKITPTETKYTKRLSELLSERTFWDMFVKQIPTVKSYLESLPNIPNSTIPENHCEDLTKFGVLCLESIVFQIDKNKTPAIHFMDIALNCSDVVFSQSNLCSILGLDSHCSWLCSAVNSLYTLLEYVLAKDEAIPVMDSSGLSSTLGNLETLSAGQACYQLSALIRWVEKLEGVNIPDFFFKPIRSILVSLSRLPLVNSYVLTPPMVWKHGWDVELTGGFNTQVPPLPIEFLQDVEVLEEFICRINLLGWVSRQQFEEMWMSLLSVLSASVENAFDNTNLISDEINSMVHLASLAVQGITSLLLQTLLEPIPGDPHISTWMHVSRDDDIYNINDKYKLLRSKLYYKYKEYSKVNSVKFPLIVCKNYNLERFYNRKYEYGQVSIEYLWVSGRIAEITNDSVSSESYLKRQKYLNDSGLDLHSCLQFLLDLYTQWIKNATPLKLLREVVRSVLVLSDIFTEKLQFSWMLDVFMNLSKTHSLEDKILHQYIIIGVCKATAVLTPDLETYEHVKKLLQSSLKSGFLPLRISSLHGILYLLQSSVIGNTRIGGLSEEIQLILPIAVEYIQNNLILKTNLSYSEEHDSLVWALTFYICENIDAHTDSPITTAVLQTAFSTLTLNVSILLHNEIIRGMERLVIKKRVGKLIDRVIKISLEKLKHPNICYALPGLQLLLTCMYSDLNVQPENQIEDLFKKDPEMFVQMIEKISTIFDRVKKSCPFEVDLLCTVLPNILNDFFPPSEILTKVIGEFLSPQQPHPKLLSGVVFMVFEKACEQNQLTLLQDWVVCSLSNFTQSLPVSMATWCLTCFFISASTNHWLRSIFPYVQSRIGRYEYEDKRMLCISATDFYRHLQHDNQRKSFVDTFNKVKENPGTPFSDLLACL